MSSYANPDIVYMVPQTPASAALILKQLKTQEVRAQVVADAVTLGRDLIAKDTALLTGVIGTEPYFDEQDKAFSGFLARYENVLMENPPTKPIPPICILKRIY